jgi:hypothetical protein
LRAIGKYCGRTLVECTLGGTCQLSNLDAGTEDGVLFPMLKDLNVGNIVRGSLTENTAEEIAEVVRRCAPRLEFFETIEENEFGEEVKEAWRTLSRQP